MQLHAVFEISLVEVPNGALVEWHITANEAHSLDLALDIAQDIVKDKRNTLLVGLVIFPHPVCLGPILECLDRRLRGTLIELLEGSATAEHQLVRLGWMLLKARGVIGAVDEGSMPEQVVSSGGYTI